MCKWIMASSTPKRCTLFIAFTCSLVSFVGCQMSFNGLDPNTLNGNEAGGNKIILRGTGFTQDFSLNDDTNGIKVYLKNDYHSGECDVITYSSNENRIVCETRALQEGLYEVILEINDVQIACTGRWRYCRFQFRNGLQNARLNRMYVTSGLVGKPTTFEGRFYTNIYENLQTSRTDENIPYIIEKITWGPSKCNPIDEVTGEPIDLRYRYEGRTDWVVIACIPETDVPGSYPIVVQISNQFGNAFAPYYTYKVDGMDRRYHYQQYAVITNVSPQNGSVEGGTLVTIDGKGFLGVDEILVAGQLCDVESQEANQIKCYTRKAPESRDMYPGGRGLTREWWKIEEYVGLDDFPWNTSDPNYEHAGFVDEALTTDEPNDARYYSRLSGFFITPRTIEAAFLVRGDDVVDLWLSNSSDPNNAVKIAYTPSYTNNFYRFETQTSSKFILERDQQYFIEARHFDYASGSKIELGLAVYSTQWTEDDVAGADNDRQLISIVSTSYSEVQVIRVAGQREVQLISINLTACGADCALSGNFTVMYDNQGQVFSLGNTSEGLTAALNSLGSLDAHPFNVTRDEDEHFINFTLSFNNEENVTGEVSLMYVGNETISISVEEIGTGRDPVPPEEFIISYAGIQSSVLSFASTAQEVQNALVDMTGFRCHSIPQAKSYHFFQDYELDGSTGGESGERVRDQDAYCGRTSLKNPNYIFEEDSSRSSNTMTAESFDISVIREVCFSIRGLGFDGTFRVVYDAYYKIPPSGSDSNYYSSPQVFINFFEEGEMPSNSWERRCFDLYDIARDDEYDFALFYYKARLIQIYSNSDDDFYVDLVTIGRRMSASSDRIVREPPARPNGIIVTDVVVEEVIEDYPKSYRITLEGAFCRHEFTLLELHDANITLEDEDRVLYSSADWPEGSIVSVEREQAATPAVTGTFDLQFNGTTFTGVDATVTEEDLKQTLETELMTGFVTVTRLGLCSAYSWQVKFEEKGGIQPLITVPYHNLTNMQTSVDVEVRKEVDGRYLIHPIPGEYFRSLHEVPQVQVKAKQLMASCSDDCSFEYTHESTPTLLSISPMTGSSFASTEVTITGTKFSTMAEDNTVTINGVECMVTASTDESIMCDVGEVPGGQYAVKIHVRGLGRASTPNGTVYFTYPFNITSVSPSRGSTAGGTIVTVTGLGFGEDMIVTVAGIVCDIIDVSYINLTCKVRKEEGSLNDSTVSLSLSNGEHISQDNLFTLDPSVTPNITSISLNQSTVEGGSNLTIVGNGFGMTGSIVMVGEEDCSILSQTDSEIVCVLPSNSPGHHDVVVDIDGVGYAKSQSESVNLSVNYILSVTGVFPSAGSLFGGTLVSITGQSFGTSSDDIEVLVGDLTVELDTISDDLLTFTTPKITTTHTVSHLGRHEKYGLGYAWSPLKLYISAGDIVTWTGFVPRYVTGITYSVHQTASASETRYDGSGFHSGGPFGPSGRFSYQFDSPGTYYYSSDIVNSQTNDDPIYMRGIIEVLPKMTQTLDLTVKVMGYTALHDLQTGALAPSSGDPCPGETVEIPGCIDDGGGNNTDGDVFGFTYSLCHTPIVTGITPNTGTKGTLLNITGTGFSDDACEVEVLIGGVPCLIASTSASLIQCHVDTGDTLETGVLLGISVNIKNLGFAQILPRTPIERSFVLFAQVDGVSIQQGSLAGGTEVEFTGSGFSSEPVVTIGNEPCILQEANYTFFMCITSPNNEGQHQIDVQVGENKAMWGMPSNMFFNYSSAYTPIVASFTPSVVSGASTILTFNGSFLNADTDLVTITIGGETCVTNAANDTYVECDVSFVPVGTREMTFHLAGSGAARFEVQPNVWSSKDLFSITPSSGSTQGGLVVVIEGNGFIEGDTLVLIGSDTPCDIQSVSLSTITCETFPHPVGSETVSVTSSYHSYINTITFQYSSAATPQVTSISPESGQSGDTITILGSAFSNETADVTVIFDGVACNVTAASETSISCVTGYHSAGVYSLEVHIDGKGLAWTNATFEYSLNVSSVSPNEGSFGGGRNLTISGSGFDMTTSSVYVCENQCHITSATTSYISCEVPPNYADDTDLECKVKVMLESGSEANATDTFTYKRSLTPTITSVEPKRGGTAGGTSVTIDGTGFLSSGNEVTIGGTDCVVQTESVTQIRCVTEAHLQSERTQVKVMVGTNGAALAQEGVADYYYIDVWSSRFTWGGNDPPEAGTFVEIPAGQTILLDINTPVLRVLLISGGSLIFDDERDIELSAEYIIITDGGHLGIGTEEQPYQHKGIITLHGHVRSIEIPFYGAKVLAVRNGSLELHGQPIPVMWTHLSETAYPNDTQITLKQPVTWNIGDEIIIATTGGRLDSHQSEVVTITDISADNLTLTIDPPLEYKHISLIQDIHGVILETRAEVGLLTHNVVVRGNVNEDWTEDIEACEQQFQTGMFQTQTCFLGRFGDETASDQFGGHVMIFARDMDAGLVHGHIEYVEFTHVGQAFRLGRYPIHFHMNGDVSGSYVRGCSIHHTFNRAVTIHGVHNLLVEHNVAYNVMGHAYFMEDGIETKNIIQYNLAVFVRSSSSLLNVDVTPASFWVTNPDNYVRHNAAAGGSHFGFWYNMPEHPGGPSETDTVCPRHIPVLEFHNNTAHTFGWYGLWVFPSYHPKVTGDCNDFQSGPAIFENLTVWNTERGAEVVSAGAVQLHNILTSDTEISGLEYQKLSGAPWHGTDGAEGPLIKDSVVIGRSDGISGSAQNASCTHGGLVGPGSHLLTVDGVRFINFDRETCAAVRACSKCKPDQGGFTTRFKNLQFTNAANKVGFQWLYEAVLEDLDGTLTGLSNSAVVPDFANLPDDHCIKDDAAYALGAVPGAMCDSTISFHRFAFNEPLPSSLLYEDAILTNIHGSAHVKYHKKRITHPNGWMILLIRGEHYDMSFLRNEQITNISYTGRFDAMQDGDYVLITHNLTQKVDVVSIVGDIRNSSETMVTYDDNVNGDYYLNRSTNDLTYIISGKDLTAPVDRWMDLDIYRCYFEDCLPPVPEVPPDGRPENVLYWSDPRAWENVTEEWGGFNGTVPKDHDDVQILPGLYIVANDTLPIMNRLFIYGTLELDDVRNYTLRATYILIQGGKLVIGHNETTPFNHNVHIILNGDHSTPDLPLSADLNLGSKAIGVFGVLELHGKAPTVTWTRLDMTVNPGDNSITLEEDTDWKVGDEIAVATTDFESWHTETFNIITVTNARTFVLNASFVNRHAAATDNEGTPQEYRIAAEVGLFTRNIVIEGASYDGILDQLFGARVLVGSFVQDQKLYHGTASISNVQFKYTGQEGWVESYDPRFSLAFLNLYPMVGIPPSSVTGCSFHHGFSTAIGIFSSPGVIIRDNVVHHTIGAGIKIEGSEDVILEHNLVMIAISKATYQDRYQKENIDWFGAIDFISADGLVMRDNAVAGSEKAGIKMDGEPCDQDSSFSGNVVHSAIQGVMLFLESQDTCTSVANFFIYRCYHYGIYFQVHTDMVHVTNTTLVDNRNGIFPMIFRPRSLSHIKRDKVFQLTNTLISGHSSSFDCALDIREPEVAGFEIKHRPVLPPGGGVVGVVLTTYMSGPNGAAFFSFKSIHNYPALGGNNKISGVTFMNFDDHCGAQGRAFITNSQSDDATHPTEVQNINLISTSNESIVFIHRPPIERVNPSDCVDMDCDGMKKTLIRDLDGSMLGSIGTIVPDSAYEWDGDPRRGLGDYRIPRMLLTDPVNGDRLDIANVAPNKGIIGTNGPDCTWSDSWQAYKCHNYDHMMMVIESMDADTEVRRVSPVALLADGYVDLINGPQDHGWCLGYTCQERISTFYTLVATGKEYEVFFTGTNPQRLRVFFLNANDDQSLVVGIWYANPQRLDVYSNGVYILPNNAEYVNDRLTWLKPQTPNQFYPNTSMNNGANYFDRTRQTLYMVVRGSNIVEIKTTPAIIVAFSVPSIPVDDFFEVNLVENLANLLGISKDNIRVVNIIREDSRRKRRQTGGDTVEIEIVAGNQTSSAGNDTDETGSVEELNRIQASIVNEQQEGNLGGELNITITSMSMTDPIPPPVDPTGGVRATNGTGGPADGNQTYSDRQQEEEAQRQEELSQPIVYLVPSALVVVSSPMEGSEHAPFPSQPTIKVVDQQGSLVSNLGHSSNPWQVTATLSVRPTGSTAALLGNATIPFVSGWANFTSLAVDKAGTGYVLQFEITNPNTSVIPAVVSGTFSVTPRQLTAVQGGQTGTVYANEAFQVLVEIRDVTSGEIVTNLEDSGYNTWMAIVTLYEPSNYRGQLSGGTNVSVDLSTGVATFPDLVIDTDGYGYVLNIAIFAVGTESYTFSVQLDAFDVVVRGAIPHDGKVATGTVTFDAAYSVVEGNEDAFINLCRNKLFYKYTNVTFSNFVVNQGSILLSFTMTGDTDGTVEVLYDDLLNGDFVVTFNGVRLEASPTLIVNGQEYTRTAPPSPFPLWAIIVCAIAGVLMLLIIFLIIFVKCCLKKDSKVAQVETMPLTTRDAGENKTFARTNPNQSLDVSPTGSRTTLLTPNQLEWDEKKKGPKPKSAKQDGPMNKQLHLLVNEDGNSLGRRSPNSPRRTPEVEVTSLPPGFTEGQIEKEIEDRADMPVNIKNPDGTFQKIGQISANRVGTLSDLRRDLKKSQSLPPKVQEKPFVFLRADNLGDYETLQEKKVSVSEAYGSTGLVLIRWHTEQDGNDLCVCGLVGQFYCSLCDKQAYCSPQCQSTDWPRHTMPCSAWATERKEREALEKK